MATNYPTSLDSYSDVATGDTIQATTTNNTQDAIEALEAKVGVDSSAVTSSHDYLLRNIPTQESDLNVGGNNLIVDTDTLYVDAANDRVGINTSSPDNSLHMHAGSAGSVVSNGNTQATLENSADVGFQLLCPSSNAGRLYFGDADNSAIAYLEYSHSNNKYTVVGNGTTVLTVDSAGLSYHPGGVRIGTDVNGSRIDDASNGAGSNTLYIGNRTIDTSASDMRYKVESDEKIDALGELKKLKLHSYKWDEDFDSDTETLHFGLFAQEASEVNPAFAIAPQNEETGLWKTDDHELMGYVIQAIHDLAAKVSALEAKIK